MRNETQGMISKHSLQLEKKTFYGEIQKIEKEKIKKLKKTMNIRQEIRG